MKKITLSFFFLMSSFLGFSQINEGFEGATFPPTTPTSWAVFNTNTGPAVLNWTLASNNPFPPYTGANAAIIDRVNIGQGNTMQNWLVTPKITVSANNQLKFFSRLTNLGPNATNLEIRISTDPIQSNLAAYTTVQTWDDNTMNAGAYNIYEEKAINLSAYPSGTQLYIAFVKVHTQTGAAVSSDRWLIDDVQIVTQCLTPLAPNVLLPQLPNSANLAWTNPSGATQWEVEVVPEFSSFTGTGIIVNTNPYVYGGLTPSTTYEYRVRAICSATNKSQWSTPLNFSTANIGATCSVPINISALPFSQSSNTNLYGDDFDVSQGTACGAVPATTNYFQGDEVFYSYIPTFTGNISINMTASGPSSSLFVYNGCANVGVNCLAGVANAGTTVRTIPNLAVVSGQTYIIAISSSTTPLLGLPYNLVIQQVTCNPPTPGPVTNIGMTTANISWTGPAGATAWEVAVLPFGSPIPGGSGVSANTNVNFTYSGLTSGTAYEYWVRADCGNGTFSPWAGPRAFNTSVCEVADQCNYTFRLTSTSGGWRGALMEVRQNNVVVATLGSAFTTGTVYNSPPVPLCQNYPFQLYWINSGTTPANVGIQIINNAPFSQTIYTKAAGTGSPSLTVPLYQTSINCSAAACLDPLALNVIGAPTTTSAVLGWTSTIATTWNIYLVPNGSPAPTATSIPTYAGVNTNPFTVNGLIQNTTYQFYVQSICGPTSISNWSAPFSFITKATCLKQTSLVTSLRTATSIRLAWTNPGIATSWEVLALSCGAPAPNATTPSAVLATTNPFTLTGLSAGTCYDFYVRGVCSATDSSDWSLPKTDFTSPGCGGSFFDDQGPNLPYVSDANSTVTICPAIPGQIVTVTFTSFNTEATYDGLYVYDGNSVTAPQIASTNPIGAGIPLVLTTPGAFWGTTIPGPFTSSSTDGCLTFNFKSDDGVERAGWVANVTCSPPPTCTRPKLLTAINVAQTTATLGWTQPANPNGSLATTWQVLTLPCGSPTPTSSSTGSITVTNNPFVITGLIPGTCYDYYVRAVCSSTDSSIWSMKKSFTTLLINDECSASIPLAVNQNTRCSQTTFGTVGNATASPQANSCGATADDDDVWYHFTATATTHYISLLEPTISTANPPAFPTTPNGGLNYSLYRGNSCGSLIQVSCRAANGGMETGLIIGETYKVRVYSPGTSISSKKFEICIGTKVITCENAFPLCAITPVIIRNDVGVPANPNPISGSATPTVGCLGSAPSPTYYTLTLQNSGNYKFFIEQSTDPAFPGTFETQIDVDYVTWGPFASPSVACGLININNTRPSPDGCSFDGANTETFTITGGIAGQTYIVMITNYTATSDYPGKRGYIRITQTDGPLPSNCCPFTNYTYPKSFYCQNEPNPSPTLEAGATGGTYSSTLGLVIDSVTGQIDLAASVMGNYIVTSIIPATGGATGCQQSTSTWSISIAAPPTATISYSAQSFCSDLTTLQAVTQTGNTGGSYYATIPGLTINSSTGAINPSTSTPGNYTVVYAVANVTGCPTFTTDTQVSITKLPIATFNYASTPYCQNAANPSPTFTGGATAGSFNAVSPATGLVINSVTGIINLASSTPGTYIVENKFLASGGCAEVTATSTITITTLPIAGFNYSNATFCQVSPNASPIFTTGATSGVFSLTSGTGLIFNSSTGIIDVSSSLPGTYTITNTIAAANGCPNVSASTVVKINPNPIATISSSDLDNTICSNENATINLTAVNFQLSSATYTWFLNGNTIPNNTSTIVPIASGIYKVEITLNGCKNTSTISLPFTINPQPKFTLLGDCLGNSYIITSTPVSGSFNPTPTTVTYQWTNESGTIVGKNQNTFNVTEYVVANNVSPSSFPTSFTVKVTTIPDGCTDTQTFQVKNASCVVQKGLSPNGDGSNDSFDLRGLDVKQLSIFNRYGTKIYSQANYKDEWQGQNSKSENSPVGTYYYVIELNNGETKTGWIYLNR